MQVVMWLIFGGSLGLAQFISYHRAQAPVALGPPVRLGPFMVRMPEGWSYTPPTRSTMSLRAYDPETGQGVLVRVILGDQQPLAELEDAATARPMAFKGLHVQGSMAVIKQTRQGRHGPVQEQVLTAFAMLPAAHVGVLIELGQLGPRIGPADKRLIQELADAITLAEPGTIALRVPPAPLGVRLSDRDATAELELNGGTVKVMIDSPRPSGHVTLSPRGSWPAGKLVLRLEGVSHLDRLRVRNDQVALHISSDPDERPTLWRMNQGAESDPLKYDPAYDAPMAEQDDGVEVTLPRAMYPAGTKELTVEWSGA